MKLERIELMPDVWLSALRMDGFKCGYWSLQLLAPMKKETAALNAALPYVLRRGCARLPDDVQLSNELESLYGADITPRVSKRGDVQCVGFSAVIPECGIPESDSSRPEQAAGLLGELLLHPATKNGRLRQDYVLREKQVLLDRLESASHGPESVRDRLIAEMCAGDPFAVNVLGDRASAEKITVARLFYQYQTMLSCAPVEVFYCGSLAPRRVELILREALMGLPRAAERYDPVTRTRRPEYSGVRQIRRDIAGMEPQIAVGFRLGFGRSDVLYPPLLVAQSLLEPQAPLALDDVKGIAVLHLSGTPEDLRLDYHAAMDRISSVQQGSYSDADFAAARDRTVQRLYAALDDPEQLCRWWLCDRAAGEQFEPEALIRQASEVTPGMASAAAMELLTDTVLTINCDLEEGTA